MSYSTQDELDASSDWNHLTFTWARGTAYDDVGDATETYLICVVPFSKTATDSNSNTVTVNEGYGRIETHSASYFNGLSDADYINWVKTQLGGDPVVNNLLQEKLNALT